MDQMKILVSNEYENERIDKVIASEADTLSRSFVQKIIKNNEVNSNTLSYVEDDKVLFEMCLENMIKNGKVNRDTLIRVKNDEELFKMYIEISIKIKYGRDETSSKK